MRPADACFLLLILYRGSAVTLGNPSAVCVSCGAACSLLCCFVCNPNDFLAFLKERHCLHCLVSTSTSSRKPSETHGNPSEPPSNMQGNPSHVCLLGLVLMSLQPPLAWIVGRCLQKSPLVLVTRQQPLQGWVPNAADKKRRKMIMRVRRCEEECVLKDPTTPLDKHSELFIAKNQSPA